MGGRFVPPLQQHQLWQGCAPHWVQPHPHLGQSVAFPRDFWLLKFTLGQLQTFRLYPVQSQSLPAVVRWQGPEVGRGCGSSVHPPSPPSWGSPLSGEDGGGGRAEQPQAPGWAQGHLGSAPSPVLRQRLPPPPTLGLFGALLTIVISAELTSGVCAGLLQGSR